MADQPHPVELAGTREGEIDAWGHSVDAPRDGTPFVPSEQIDHAAARASFLRRRYEKWRRSAAGQAWFSEREAIVAGESDGPVAPLAIMAVDETHIWSGDDLERNLELLHQVGLGAY